MKKIQRSWCIALKKGSMVKTMFYKVVAREKCDIFFFGDEDRGVIISPQILIFPIKNRDFLLFYQLKIL